MVECDDWMVFDVQRDPDFALKYVQGLSIRDVDDEILQIHLISFLKNCIIYIIING